MQWQVCAKGGPKGGTKEWVTLCRQPFRNETVLDKKGGAVVHTVSGGSGGGGGGGGGGGAAALGTLAATGARLQSFDRSGWLLQQFIKLGVKEPCVYHKLP